MLAAAPPNPYLPVRTRYFDDRILELCSIGGQLVLLGAGMDTRAYRLTMPEGVRVFEIDHAEAFAAKEELLRDVALPVERRTVAADFTESWVSELLSVGFRPGQQTVWLAEGLFFYLQEPVVRLLLREAARLSDTGSVFLADLFGTGLLTLPSMRELVASRRQTGAALPFCWDEPAQLFAEEGWAETSIAEPGSEEANFGRMHSLPTSRSVGNPSTSHSYLACGVC